MSKLPTTCQLSIQGQNWFNSGMPTQLLQVQYYSKKVGMSLKISIAVPTIAKGNINHCHVAEQINCNMPTFNKMPNLSYPILLDSFMLITRWHLNKK
jgi:hypothetical protein